MKKSCSKPKKAVSLHSGFSLVEMLMALLVASLLLAALAPVMTKKIGETVNVSGVGNGSKSDYQRVYLEDSEWQIPKGVNLINVTAIGGGGAGGGATYGFQEFTSSLTGWKVPDGVTKLRVFMVGGGGAGASGGRITKDEIRDLPAGYYDYKDGTDGGGGIYAGQKINDLLTKKYVQANYSYTLPSIDEKCKLSGNTEWQSMDISSIKSLVVKATGCGAGGAGTGSSGGGSGAYVVSNITLTDGYRIHIPGIATTGGGATSQAAGFSSGSGGSGGGPYPACSCVARVTGNAGTAYGGKGGIGVNTLCGCTGTVTAGGNAIGTLYSYGGTSSLSSLRGGRGSYWGGAGGAGSEKCNAGGGGGGGPAILSDSTLTNILLIASGGGGAGGGGGCAAGGIVGGGGGGGGPHGGGGGGGNSLNSCDGRGGAGGGSGAAGGNYATCVGSTCPCGGPTSGKLSGAGGGAYPNGVSGRAATYDGAGTKTVDLAGGSLSSNVFGENYCNGGGYYGNGKPGAIRLEWNEIKNGLKCSYNTYSNSGAGGGAGQIWIGEINVTPGQTVNFNIGSGGAKPTSYSANGNNGNPTSIVTEGRTYSVSGGLGGKYESDDTYIANSKGLGGKFKNTSLGDGSTYINWTGNNYGAGGSDGENGKTTSNGAGGGKGGNIYKFDGTLVAGGNGGGAQTDGLDAVSTNYGAGGGGGGGVANIGNLPGYGGKGADGYIYIEWGSTNGGGGAAGQVVAQKNVFVQPESTLKIVIGKGGKAEAVKNTTDGIVGFLGQDGNNGGNSYIQGLEGTKEKVLLNAKGGLGGRAGNAVHGFGGNHDEAIENSAKGEDGTDNYAGNGGSITEEICPLLSELKKLGLGGCGGVGNSPNPSTCYSSGYSNSQGSNAKGPGNGGGGGSIKNGTAHKGGDGADGMVILEWSN